MRMPGQRCGNRNRHYTNAVVLSMEGKLLATIDGKRVEWYLKRKLAAEVPPPEGYPRAIQLNFKPKIDREPEIYDIAIVENQCILCGARENLTMHHVIPHVIRKLFPVVEKSRSRQWCVLLCIDCHEKTELVTQAVYKKDYPNGVDLIKEKNQRVLRHLKANNLLDRLDDEKFHRMMAEEEYKTIEDIPEAPTKNDVNNIHMLSSTLHKKAITEWGHKFIADHGGIPGTKTYFRELFMSLKPKYLPPGYLDL